MSHVIYYKKAERFANAPVTAETDHPPVFVEQFDNGTHTYTHEVEKAKRFDLHDEAVAALPTHQPFEMISVEQLDYLTSNSLPLPPTEFVPPAATEAAETSPGFVAGPPLTVTPDEDFSDLVDEFEKPSVIYWKSEDTKPMFFSGESQQIPEQDFWTEDQAAARVFINYYKADLFATEMRMVDFNIVTQERAISGTELVNTIYHDEIKGDQRLKDEVAKAMQHVPDMIGKMGYYNTLVPDVPEWYSAKRKLEGESDEMNKIIQWRIDYVKALEKAIPSNTVPLDTDQQKQLDAAYAVIAETAAALDANIGVLRALKIDEANGTKFGDVLLEYSKKLNDHLPANRKAFDSAEI